MEVNVTLSDDGNMLRIFEKRILRMIYGPIDDNGIWRPIYNNKLSTPFDELHLFEVIKIARLSWLGQLFRMQALAKAS
jgi:hypothetical protein